MLTPDERQELEDIRAEARRIGRNARIIVRRAARLIEGSGDNRQPDKEGTRNDDRDRD